MRTLTVLCSLLFFLNLYFVQVDNISIDRLHDHFRRVKREHRRNILRHLKWSHSVWLGERMSSPRLYWNPKNGKNGYVEFKIEANTIGSIRLGFDKEDVIMLWVDDVTLKAHVEDLHYGNLSSIVHDTEESYIVIAGEQNRTHTEIAFRRLWNTCDSQDAILGPDTVRISWSIHPDDRGEGNNVESEPQNDYGAIRGEKSLLLQTPIEAEIPNSHHVNQWGVLMKDVLVRDDTATQYWCKVFRTPALSKKNHIIAYEPVILSDSSNLIHHMILYECDAPPGYLDSYTSPDHKGAPCYSSDMPRDWESCVAPVATWVIGGDKKILPEHVGLPMGPRQTYFMLEIHYDNPGLKRVLDNSGFNLFHTEDLRKNDGGVMMTGVSVSPLHLIPPLQPRFRSVGLCNDGCTSKVFPQMGIKLVSVLLHSHVAGRKMRLRHVRGDKEMPHIVEDQKYDSSYQVDRFLREEVTVFPADQLVTECNYDTSDRNTPTFGGYSTRSEMCLSFITYYPRTELASCHSLTPVRYFFKALGINTFYNVTMDEVERHILRNASLPKIKKINSLSTSNEAAIAALKKKENYLVEGGGEENPLLNLVISEPNEFRDRTLAGHLKTLPWNDSTFSKSFEMRLAEEGLEIVYCRLRNDGLAIPTNIESFPSFKRYSPKTKEECHVTTYMERSSGEKLAFSNVFNLLLILLCCKFHNVLFVIC